MRKSKGFTLVESLVAVALFTIAILPMFELVLNYRRRISDMQVRTNAMTAAQQVAETYRQGNISTLPSSGTQNVTITLNGDSYIVYTDICVTTTYCTSATRDLVFRVNFNGQQKYYMRAIFSQLQ